MSQASVFATKRQQTEAQRPTLVIQGMADPVALVDDQGRLVLPHDTVFDQASARLLALWIRDTFT